MLIKGKNFTITDREIKVKMKAYKLKGYNNPKQAAIKHLVERKVLLNKSLEKGYTVTENDIDNQVQEDANLFAGRNKRKPEIINELAEEQEILITDSNYQDIVLLW